MYFKWNNKIYQVVKIHSLSVWILHIVFITHALSMNVVDGAV